MLGTNQQDDAGAGAAGYWSAGLPCGPRAFEEQRWRQRGDAGAGARAAACICCLFSALPTLPPPVPAPMWHTPGQGSHHAAASLGQHGGAAGGLGTRSQGEGGRRGARVCEAGEAGCSGQAGRGRAGRGPAPALLGPLPVPCATCRLVYLLSFVLIPMQEKAMLLLRNLVYNSEVGRATGRRRGAAVAQGRGR